MKKYKAILYLRLSKEDKNKDESNSILNQRNLIYEYLKNHKDIEIYCEKSDDGYSGVNFDRPAFKEMIDEIKNGNSNCIIVKDLSRFGRNYIEVGKYIEKIFPFMGIRFIAINDNYDSFSIQTFDDDILIPFKNLINDSYSRDISIKVRSQLDIKRKSGDFINSFPVYGYLKLESNKNKLIIDNYASEIVKNIFKWYRNGISCGEIANKLNNEKVLSPALYKEFCGFNYKLNLHKGKDLNWSYTTIRRILKDEIYTGMMIQGKSSKPNYKTNYCIKKSEKDWIKVENTHEAIINKKEFEAVQSFLKKDMRISPKNKHLGIFSGMLYCADCKNSMVKRNVKKAEKIYYYYNCSSYKNNKICSYHNISEKELVNVIITILNINMNCTSPIDINLNKEESEKINTTIENFKNYYNQYNNLKISLYEDFVNKIIDKNEYLNLKEVYSKKCSYAEKQIIEYKEKLKDIKEKNYKFEKINKLSYFLVTELIEKIFIHENNKIYMSFKYRDEYLKVLKS